MLYRLLRNNKETGPFNALQLKEMGLKPYDLLWTEGRGAAWQYASEISELKDFAPVVEEQPFERLNKRKENAQTAVQTEVALKKVKPRYRISNGQLIMVEAGNMEVGTNGVIKETTPFIKETTPVHHINTTPVEIKATETPDWQNTYPQWQPQPKKEIKAEEPVEIETKYSESLDDLKKRYAEKVLGGSKETSSSSLSSASIKQNIMAVVALVVLVAGGYIGYTLKKKDDASITSSQPAVERADITGNNAAVVPQPSSDNNNTSEKNVVAENKSVETKNNAAVKNEGKNAGQAITAANSGSKPTPVIKESGNKNAAATVPQKTVEIIAKTSANAADKAINKPVTPDNKTTVKTSGNNAQQTSAATVKNNSTAVAPTPSLAPAVPVAKPANKQISDYVAVKKLGGSGAGVQNIKLMVSNVSDFPIDLAVVDIQYFDSKGKYQKGETMYVKDINGGNNVEVRVPDSDKSSSIKYKVSMVQADQKTLYMVAD